MVHFLSRLFCHAALAAISTLAHAAPSPEAVVPDGDVQALEAATAATCRKHLVLLGEASHGDGHSDGFKSALVQRLVDRCGFNTVLFEASFYEFIPIARNLRRHQPVSPELVAAAVGGLWKFDRELLPLFDFLAAKASQGKVQLGGLDFQAGGFQQPYSNDVMITELTAHMPAERRHYCNALFHSRIYGDDAPGGLSDRQATAVLRACLLEANISTNEANGPIDGPVLENLLAWLDTENMPIPQRIQARDRLMAGNARRVIGPGSGGKRVVMWLHNGHAARSTAALGDYRGADNLGASLARQYGNRLYSLAMTAHGGEYRWSPGTNKPLPASPGGSLESRFGSEDKSVFVSKARLKQTANCAAGVFGHSFVEARWHDAFDGIVVLNAEHPPHSTRP